MTAVFHIIQHGQRKNGMFIIYYLHPNQKILQQIFQMINSQYTAVVQYNLDSFILFNMGKEKNGMFIIYYLHPNQNILQRAVVHKLSMILSFFSNILASTYIIQIFHIIQHGQRKNGMFIIYYLHPNQKHIIYGDYLTILQSNAYQILLIPNIFILFNIGKEKNGMFIIYYLHPNQKVYYGDYLTILQSNAYQILLIPNIYNSDSFILFNMGKEKKWY
ncbi:hypothetical protein ACJX0J_037655, partial [Zea mays]